MSGVMGTGIERQGRIPVAADQRFRFSRVDGRCFVFVTRVPSTKEDTTLHFELYDEDNRRLAATDLPFHRVTTAPGPLVSARSSMMGG